MRKICVSDITLKMVAQSRENVLFRQKTALAACIDTIGVDKIELPIIARPKEDSIIIKTISSIVNNCELAIPVGYSAEEVDAAWECVCNAAKPCLQVGFPVSTAQMEYRFRAKENTMLGKITNIVSLAKEKCENVEFIAFDSTRADISFLIEACNAAKENGAVKITLCDDAGIAIPEEIYDMVSKVKAACGLPVSVSLSDAIGLEIACAFAAIKAGADEIKTAILGDEVVSIKKFADAIKAKGEAIGVYTNIKMTEIHRDITAALKGIFPENNKEKQADGSDNVSDIYLDSQSTITDVGNAIKTLGYDISSEDCGKIHKELLQLCERKSALGAKELEALIASYAMQVADTYQLENYTATCSELGQSMASITLARGDEILNGVAIGDGPIDCAFKAIEQCIGFNYELDAFEIQAVTEGKEALGSALVRLRNNGKLYSGNGISTDIVSASIRAYINALNKIVFEEN